MSVSFGSNIASLKAQRQLGNVSNDVRTVFERLSSGQRINKASDDAAGLSVVSSLEADRRVFTQGIRNYNDGISLLNVADGAVEQLSGIVIKLKELAEQAANGTYGGKQRIALDAEGQALAKEYVRIARSTAFNGRGIFDASFGELRLQGGYGVNGGIQSGLGGAIGTGSFGSPATYFSEGGDGDVNGIAFGDLNGDGILDMVTAEMLNGANGGYASVRIGRGDGTFGNTTTYNVDADLSANSISLADLNGDGKLDMLAGTGTGNIVRRLGNGDGTFGSSLTYAFGSNPINEIEVGDLNGDGFLDVAATNFSSQVVIRLGTGTGSFGGSVTYGGTYTDLRLADLNGDGALDLGASGTSAGGWAYVQLGSGSGTFGSATSYQMGTTSSGAIDLGDVNGDGITDIAALARSGGSNSISVRLGLGGGTFGAMISSATLGIGTDLTLADLNGDGNLDMIGTNNGASLEIKYGNGDGTFAASASFGTGINEVALGDFNGDGVYDIATNVSYGATVRITQTSPGISSLLAFKLTSRADALQALSQFDQALNRLSTQRGIIGAFQSRITVAGNTLQASADNYAAAAGRIKDADVADESSKLVRTQILQQAASAVLSQANQQPALAIQLLSNDS